MSKIMLVIMGLATLAMTVVEAVDFDVSIEPVVVPKHVKEGKRSHAHRIYREYRYSPEKTALYRGSETYNPYRADSVEPSVTMTWKW